MVSINKIPNSFQSRARKFITQMANPEALAPIILLEAAVTGGRTYQAYQRGGFVEARERGTEETFGAIFWLGGVNAFNKLGNILGAKFFKVEDVDFDAAKDAVRNPFKNFVGKTKLTEGKLTAFKFGRTIASILLANAIIGFVVPKINQRITKHYQDTIKHPNEDMQKADSSRIDMGTFITQAEANNKTPSFKGGVVQRLLSISDKFEHDAKYKLLSTDAGVAGGRAYNARNKHERTEILVRDVGSLYFYMFCKNHINAALNKIQTGKAQRLDPTSVEILDTKMKEIFTNAQEFSAAEFRENVLGKNVAIPEHIRFNKNEITSLRSFQRAVGENTTLAKTAEEMVKLQPKLKNTVAILTKAQVEDIYSGGLINEPSLLNSIYTKFTYTKATGGKSTNPTSFVPEKDLRALKGRMVEYVRDIIKTADGKQVTTAVLEKVNKKNLISNGVNLGVGLGVSAIFLSLVIPKIQYWITRMHTGTNNFPGVEKYEK